MTSTYTGRNGGHLAGTLEVFARWLVGHFQAFFVALQCIPLSLYLFNVFSLSLTYDITVVFKFVFLAPFSPSSIPTLMLPKDLFFQQEIPIMSLPWINLSVTTQFLQHKAQIPQQGSPCTFQTQSHPIPRLISYHLFPSLLAKSR